MQQDATPRPATQKDVACALKMAQSTVSMALRNDLSIPEQTRHEVQRMARQMGYRPNPTGTALAHLRNASRTRPVCAALAWMNCWEDPAALRRFREFDLYWQGAADTADKLGYRLDEFIVNDQMPLSALGRIFTARNVNGILLPPGPLPKGWQDFDWGAFSVVRMSRASSETDLPACTVTSHQPLNAAKALREMCGLGYQRIGFIGIPWPERLFGAGFLWEQQAQPPDRRIEPLLLLPSDRQAWQTHLEEWLNQYRPDAILTDIPEVPDMLSSAGHRVPDDIGVASLGLVDCHTDAGINQQSEEIGRAALLTLNALIHEGACGVPAIRRELLVEGTWVHGKSLPDRQAP